MKSGKQHTNQDQLQHLLNRQIKALSEEAIQSDGHISGSKLETMLRLSRLAEMQKATSPPASRSRWPVITLLAVTLITVSLLLFARVSSTEIELDLLLSEVGFRLPEQQVLTDEMRLSSLGVSGLQEIQLPRSEKAAAQVLETPGSSGLAIQLIPEQTDSMEGSVTLAAIILPAGAHIGLRTAEIPKQFRLSIKGSGSEIRAGVHGLIEVGQPGMAPGQANFLGPKLIVFRSGQNDIDLDINLLTGTGSKFSRALLTDSLSLFRIDQHVTGEQTIIRRASTVLSGTLYFESLGGKERLLRPGQDIRFKSSAGEIRTLELKDDHIVFAFHGCVEGMTVGGEKNSISLMPTYLEWLSARHGLSLLWGTTLYLFGIIFGVWRWWKTSS